MATAKKWVYFFESSNAEGNASMKGLLGGKGAGLAEMSNIGIPVPPGFTISTETCVYYSTHDKTYPDGLEAEIDKNLNRLEETIGKRFGDKENPLLVSVRSGAKFSMPGMMDTVLNLGLNDDTVAGMANKTGNGRFAYDSYRRFIQMFGNVVLEIEHHDFENILNVVKKENGIKLDTELTVDNLKDVIGRYKEMTRRKKGIDFPAVPREQLKLSIKAVFDSWNNPRAITYREINRIPDDLGTAVNVQMMVFGNMGANSGTGVAFTRDPSTGEKRFVGEYLINAQGEDVVAGIRTPSPISKLKEEMPDVFDQLEGIYRRLESHYRDMQDIEFTTEEGKLYLLQTRTGKRTAASALKIAVDMADEKLISKEEAVSRVDPLAIDKLLHPQIDPEEEKKYEIIARGLSASPGVATGVAVLSADKAVKLTKGSDKGVITVKEETIGPADNPSSVEGILGETFVLVSSETTPEDIAGMEVSQGILTARGGMTSHAAIVARERGKAAVVGCESIEIDDKNKLFKVGDIIIREGDFITIDGSTGKVFKGKIPTIDSEIIRVLRGETPSSELYRYYDKLMTWADEISSLKVRTNADSPEDARVARDFGAKGIGLCRTEHMFFEDRLPTMQRMILARNEEERKEALQDLLPMQKEDFKTIFQTMRERPVTIRLLDAPLHEFLPNMDELKQNIDLLERDTTGGDNKRLVELKGFLKKVIELKEVNPMLGHRGCRLGITYPEVTEMQVTAIFEAACEVSKEEGINLIPEIMIPLIGHVNELKNQREVIDRVAKDVMDRYKVEMDYMVGTMIELPRAALTADRIAEVSDFFSFGTNDLTQTTFGFSRDDAEFKFLKKYREIGIFGVDDDPFVTIDQEGVGRLVQEAVKMGKSTNPGLKIGICGEHGGDPRSVEFFHRAGLNYVSCSPYRVPIARLAAAHARLKESKTS